VKKEVKKFGRFLEIIVKQKQKSLNFNI